MLSFACKSSASDFTNNGSFDMTPNPVSMSTAEPCYKDGSTPNSNGPEHGEPGAAVANLQPAHVVVSHILQQILSPETNYLPIKRGSGVVLMINGLGGTPLMELMIAAGKAVHQLQLEFGLVVERVYTGSFMTSLDMAGFSISVMRTDEALLERLDAPTKAPHWPVGAGVGGNHPPAKIPVSLPPSNSAKTEEVIS